MSPKKDEYMRGYSDGFKDGKAHAAIPEMLEALREARHLLMAPAEDLLWSVIGRIDAAITKASQS